MPKISPAWAGLTWLHANESDAVPFPETERNRLRREIKRAAKREPQDGAWDVIATSMCAAGAVAAHWYKADRPSERLGELQQLAEAVLLRSHELTADERVRMTEGMAAFVDAARSMLTSGLMTAHLPAAHREANALWFARERERRPKKTAPPRDERFLRLVCFLAHEWGAATGKSTISQNDTGFLAALKCICNAGHLPKPTKGRVRECFIPTNIAGVRAIRAARQPNKDAL